MAVLLMPGKSTSLRGAAASKMLEIKYGGYLYCVNKMKADMKIQEL